MRPNLFSRIISVSILAAIILLYSYCAWAQNAPAGANAAPQSAATAAVDPDYLVAQGVFEGLSEADRKAVQEALIWTGDYNGTISGTFNKRTFAALQAQAKKLNLPPDRLLDEASRAKLFKRAEAFQNNVKFAPVNDKAAGFWLMMPTAIMPKITPTRNGTAFSNADNSVSLVTVSLPLGDGNLVWQFEQLKQDRSERKVTYKLLKPDFLVVAGEAGGSTFYTRLSGKAGEEVLRGYTFTYPANDKAKYDRLSIAIASHFDPFGQTTDLSAVPAGGNSSVAAIEATAAPFVLAAQQAPNSTQIVASAWNIGANQAIAAKVPDHCEDLAIGKIPAKIEKRDGNGVILSATGLNAKAQMAAAPAEGDMVVLYYGTDAKAQLSAATGQINAGKDFAQAPILRATTGGIVFNRAGQPVGMILDPEGSSPFPIRYRFVALPQTSAAASDKKLSVGEIVAANSNSVLPVSCRVANPSSVISIPLDIGPSHTTRAGTAPQPSAAPANNSPASIAPTNKTPPATARPAPPAAPAQPTTESPSTPAAKPN